jgi:hypothetical protein
MLDIHFDETKGQWKVSVDINGKLCTVGYFDYIADALACRPYQPIH